MDYRTQRLEELRQKTSGAVFVYPEIEIEGALYTFEVMVDVGIPYLNLSATDFRELLALRPPDLSTIIEQILDAAFDCELAQRERDLSERRRELLKERARRHQQSRPGFVYLLESDLGQFKIGRTKDLTKRFPAFNTFLPFDITLKHSFAAADMVAVEAYLHLKFDDKRRRGEWFELTPEDMAWICSLQDGALDTFPTCSSGEQGSDK